MRYDLCIEDVSEIQIEILEISFYVLDCTTTTNTRN